MAARRSYFVLSINLTNYKYFFSTATTNSICNSSVVNHYTSEEIFSALRNSHLYPCHSIATWTIFCPFLPPTTYLYVDIFCSEHVPFLHRKSIKLNIYYFLLIRLSNVSNASRNTMKLHICK